MRSIIKRLQDIADNIVCNLWDLLEVLPFIIWIVGIGLLGLGLGLLIGSC